MTEAANANIADYYEADTFKRIKDFADGKETPFVVIDTATIDRQYDELVEGFPYARVYYAVKANPAPQVLTMLRDKGACFDIASVYELDKVMALGVTGERISYGNTIKKAKDIRTFYEKGVRMFATDSEGRPAQHRQGGTRLQSVCAYSDRRHPDRRLAVVPQVRLPDRYGHGPADPGP